MDHRAAPLRAVFYPYDRGPRRPRASPRGCGSIPRPSSSRGGVPAELLKFGLAGGFAVTVQPTTDMPLRAQYLAATEHYASQVELGEGELRNYVAGSHFH